jgi:LacI family transcriptional regulator
MKDIARDLGLSVVTVSKVVREQPDVADRTRQRVLKRLRELNYRPNPAARSLRNGRSYTIGLIIPELVHAFWAEVAKAMLHCLRDKGYALLISSSEESADLERTEIEQLLGRRVDAIAIASAQWSVESFRRIEQHDTPYVLVDRKFAGLRANLIDCDNEGVGFEATSHLIDCGCTRIAHIRGPELSTGVGRVEGYRRALAQHGHCFKPEYIVGVESGDVTADVGGYRAMQQLLGLREPPDGVFCYNDTVAFGAIEAILEAGVRIPADVAVIGCGNLGNPRMSKVPLSTIDHNPAMIGEKATELALSLIEAKTQITPKTIQVPHRLIARESTARQSSGPRPYPQTAAAAL